MAIEPTTFEVETSGDISSLLVLHDSKGDEFLEEMASAINDWNDAWREMIYCVLAGTQVNTDIVRKAYFDLIETVPEVLDYNKIVKKSELQTEIALTLKRNGYRFHTNKAKTIVNVASYFGQIIKDYKNFRDVDYNEVRNRLIKDVSGVGNKIASHWLRNIGFQLPIIDIHLRRVLSCAGLIDKKYAKYQISNSEYWYLEKKVIEISDLINVAADKLDYILWIHGREYCTQNACFICPFKNIHS